MFWACLLTLKYKENHCVIERIWMLLGAQRRLLDLKVTSLRDSFETNKQNTHIDYFNITDMEKLPLFPSYISLWTLVETAWAPYSIFALL